MFLLKGLALKDKGKGRVARVKETLRETLLSRWGQGKDGRGKLVAVECLKKRRELRLKKRMNAKLPAEKGSLARVRFRKHVQ